MAFPELSSNKLGLAGAAGILLLIVLFLASHTFHSPELSGDARIGEIKDISVAVNGSKKVSFNASNIEEMHYRISKGSNYPVFDSLDIELDAEPSPKMKVTTLPPYWIWETDAKTVNGEFLVSATGIDPGIYNVTIRAWNHDDGNHSHEGGASETFRVDVTR